MQTEDEPEVGPDERALAASVSRVVIGLVVDGDTERALQRALPVLSRALGGRPCGFYDRAARGSALRLTAGVGDLPTALASTDLGAVGTSVPVEGHDLGALVVGGAPLDADQRAIVESVAAVLGAVLARSASAQVLREGQAMEAVGRLTVRVADDLTHLTRQVLADAEGFAHATGGDRSGIDLIRRHGRQAAAMTEQLRTFAEGAQVGAGGTDLGRVVELASGLLDGMLDPGVTIEVVGAEEPSLVTIPRPVAEQMVVRVVALVLAGAPVRPATVVLEVDDVELGGSAQDPVLEPGRYVRLQATVRPSDAGAPPVQATAARGWDIDRCRVGLARLVQPRGGDVALDLGAADRPRVAVHLPCGRADASGAAIGSLEASAGLPVVLLAEDQATVRSLLRGILTQRGYQVIEAEDGMEALRLLGSASRIDLLATDLVMPNLGGRLLAEHARSIYPDLPVIFFTGYTDAHGVAPVLPRSITLHKPFGMGDFVRCVDEMLATGTIEGRRQAS